VSSPLAIDLQNVRKTYRGKVQALRGVRMQVHPGQIFGLLGPNGAGKSTLVKIIMTVVRPTHAEGTVLGARVGHKPTLRRVGYLPEHHRFPPYLTGRQAIDLFGSLAEMRRADRVRRTAELLDIVRMSEWADRRVGTYSKGMMQRIGLAAALVNDPALVVLDEPTDGVDPVGRREIRDVLVRLRGEGRSVLVNSHLLSELEMVSDRVAIMVQGQVAAQGTLDELTAASRRYEVIIEGAAPAWCAPEGIRSAAIDERRTRLTVGHVDAARLQPTLDRLRAEGVVISALSPVRESLEDLFLRAVTDPESGQIFNPGAAGGGGSRGAAPPPRFGPGDSGAATSNQSNGASRC